MALLSLKSDKHFLRTSKGSPDVYVFEYMDDPNVFEMLRASNSGWPAPVRVGPSPQAQFKELEVLGVTIRGNQLAQLVNDLTLTAPDGQTFHLIVNRQGLCLLYVNSPSIMRLRINDYFGWSKYGVKPEVSTIWNRWDMNNGATLLDIQAMVRAASEAKEREKEMSKTVQEKNEEVENVKSELAEVKNQMSQIVQEKDKEVETVKSELTEKEKQISQTVEEMNKKVENVKSELAEKEKQTLQIVQEKNKEVETIKSKLAEKEKQVSQTVEETNKKVENVKSELAKKEKQISQIMQEKNKEAETAKLKLGEKEKQMSQTVEETNKRVENVKSELAEKEKELSFNKQLLQEKDKVVERSKEIESLLKKSGEEKDKEVEEVKNQLLAERQQVAALKAALKSLVDKWQAD